MFEITYNCTHYLSNFLSVTQYNLIVFVLLILFIISYLRFFGASKTNVLGLLFITLGGTLNLYERQVFLCVRDYIDFFGLFYFNIYDALVTSGSIILIYRLVFFTEKPSNSLKKQEQ